MLHSLISPTVRGKIFFVIIFFSLFLYAVELFPQDLPCGTTGSAPVSGQTGGIYITSQGTLKVLVVFVRFKDDTEPHSWWPVGGNPIGWDTYIDPNTQTGSTHLINLTNYYKTMSNGTFNVIGQAVSVETPQNKSYYIPQGQTLPNRFLATKEVLQQKVDPLVNFATYDNWTYDSNFTHTNQPDGTIDMIVMVWRGLVFVNPGGWSGEASMGYGGSFTVENGTKTIQTGFLGSFSSGSGVTVHAWGEKNPKYTFHAVIHEIAHWLLGSGHPYSGGPIYEFWGMLTGGSFPLCANAYEREKLAWIYPTPITNDIINAPLSDYVTTGTAYKYHPPNGGTYDYYYFENHQKLHIYDDATNNSNDKGIFVLHQGGNYQTGNIFRVKTSNGQWDWQNNGSTTCFGGSPVLKFKPIAVNRAGKSNRDKIGTGGDDWLYYLDNSGIAGWPSGGCGGWLHGEGLNNSFNLTSNNVFSNYSNPWARTWTNSVNNFTMEITAQNGSVVNARFYLSTPLAGKPSKPQNLRITSGAGNHPVLTWDANIDPDLSGYRVYKKLIYYSGGSFTSYIYTTSTTYTDNDFTITNPLIANADAEYWIVAVDNSSQLSIDSDHKTVSGQSNIQNKSVDNNIVEAVYSYKLHNNYPNPFNPLTVIQYDIKEKGLVQLKVYDILGKEVAELVNEVKEKGIYVAEFNAAELPSGVYIYSIRVNDFAASRKMLLLK